jgi:hypothetical protein
METPKRKLECISEPVCPGAPTRPLAKKVHFEPPVAPSRLFDAERMFIERNIYGELVVRHPPPIVRNRYGSLIERYFGK